MNKLYKRILLCLCVFIPSIVWSQDCGTTEHFEYLGEDAKRSLERVDQLILNNPRSKKSDEVIVVPTVVHLMHVGEEVGVGTNLSVEAVQNAIDYLNDGFRATGEFEGITEDTKIEFRLVVRDENDQPTNGINRVDASGEATYVQLGEPRTEATRVKHLIDWDNGKYMNIWVVHDIDDGNTTGYAHYPSEYTDYIPTQTGITVDVNYFNSQTLIHEAGHYLGLHHTFQGSDGASCPSEADCQTEGDKVCDTDPHAQNDKCSSFLNEDINICTGRAYGKVLHNFMSYGGWACTGLFTPGQVDRMRSMFDQE